MSSESKRRQRVGQGIYTGPMEFEIGFRDGGKAAGEGTLGHVPRVGVRARRTERR